MERKSKAAVFHKRIEKVEYVKMIKAVLVDMDGTLLNSDGKITEKTAQIIKNFQDKGGIFAINSGRGYQTASKIVKEAGIECDYIALSGAAIYDTDGNCLLFDCMTREEVSIVRKIEKKYGLYVNYLTEQGAFCERSRENAEMHYIMEARILAEDAGMEFCEEKSLDKYQGILNYVKYNFDIDKLIESGTPIFKMAIMAKDMDTLVAAKEEFWDYPELCVASTFRTNIEVNADRVDKGLTGLTYARMKGIKPEEIMVIGDSENDLPMLVQPFGLAVAMGNGSSDIKEVCTHETLSNDEDGVAYAIEKWGLK